MTRKDIPVQPAYLVWHDAFDKGAMDVFGAVDFVTAEAVAKQRNERNAETGNDDCGFWKAYTVLPRNRVFKYTPPSRTLAIV